MKTLTKKEISLMENLAGVNQKSLQKILYKFLKQNYKKVTYNKEFLLAHGNIPVALVAHMDTVFKQPAKEVFYDKDKNVMWSPTGMGADDRAGIFAIIKIIKDGFRPHIIFTTDEEIGCIGASSLAALSCPFKDLRYIVQLDRRGANDCVFYDCDNPDFEKYIESFGFVTAFGSFTDITELCPSWGMAGVNLSIGYRDEHTVSEVLFVGQMLDTIEKVERILSVKNPPSFKFIPFSDGYFNTVAKTYLNDYWENEDVLYPFSPWDEPMYKCQKCGKAFPEDRVLPIKLIKGGIGFYCEDCLYEHSHNIEWCRNCGEPFELNDRASSSLLCPECEKKK